MNKQHPNFRKTRTVKGYKPDPNCKHNWLSMTGFARSGDQVCEYCMGYRNTNE